MTAPPSAEVRLSFRQALQSPCLSCPTSPCCNLLKLHTLNLETISDVDFGLYLLNFEGLLLQMDFTGTRAHVYLQQACRHLDRDTGFCLVHRTPEQPSICVHYNEYKCSYRQHMMSEVDPDTPLVDRERMTWYVQQLELDDSGRITRYPDGQEMLAAFASMPLSREGLAAPAMESKRVIARLDDTCEGCHAWCCKTLVFERPVPVDAAEVDQFKYYLGFPSLEVGIADDCWAIVVHTTCRHLDPGNRCGVFGTDVRPMLCSQIDAVGCGYKARFGTLDPEGWARVRLEQFPLLMGAMSFDSFGRVTGVPPVQALKQIVQGPA